MIGNDDTLRAQLERLKQENKALSNQLGQRTFELQVLHDISQLMSYSINYGDLCRTMLSLLHRVVPYDISGSLLMLEEPYDLFVRHTIPLSSTMLDIVRDQMLQTMRHLTGRTILSRELRLHCDADEHIDTSAHAMSTVRARSHIPLIVGPNRDIVGLLYVASERPEGFSEDQIRVLYTIGNQTSVAIQHVRLLFASEQQRLEQLVANLPDAVLLLDASLRMMLVNTVGQEYLPFLAPGVSEGEQLTQLASVPLQEIIALPPTKSREIETVGPHSERMVFEVMAQPMESGARDGGWTIVLRNITGRKLDEEKIRNLNTVLEQRVAERTKQLQVANRDLRNEIAVRRATEEDLRRERDLLSSIMETSPVGIMMVDRTGQIIFANTRAEYVLGASRDQLVERMYDDPTWQATDYEGNPLAPCDYPFQQVLAQGSSVSDVRHAIYHPKKETRVFLSINASPLYNERNGEIERVVFSVRDVTRHLRADEALRLSEAKLRLITEQMPSILWTTDTDLMITDTMGAGLSRFGKEAHLFCNRSIDDVFSYHHETIPPEHNPVQAHRRALQGHSANYDTRIGERFFEVRVDALRNKHQQIIGCIGLALDITERKQAEEKIRNLNAELEQRVVERTTQLEAANQYLENQIQERKRAENETHRMQVFLNTILENIPDVIFVKDAKYYEFILFNKTAEQLLGLSREEMIGKTVFDFLPPDVSAMYHKRDQQVVAKGETVDIEENISAQGEDRTFRTRLIPVFNEQKKPQYVLGISSDITGRKRSEQELQRAWEAAEAATRAKSEFLANMSHEIRTPLNAIIGMTSLLLDTPLTNDQIDFVETVRISGDALLSIINDVLDFSKIEAGQLDLEAHPFHIHDFVEQALDMVAARAAEKHLNLAYTISESTPCVLVGDVTRLRQILINLLSNAVKFTEKGEVVVDVTTLHHEPATFPDSTDSTDSTDGPNGPNGPNSPNSPNSGTLYEIQVAVRDTGIGIAPTQMERLFKSFSQVDTSITRKYGGTGLGLVISKNLAHMMGGTMWLESQLGVGSTFFFTFRSCIPNEASELPKPQKIDQPELTDTHLSISDLIGRRVLIVGDNETNRHIITRYIGVWGMLPTVVVSHHDALATLQHGSLFDAIVLDIHTAGQDDTDDIFQMAEELQQYAANPPIPVVLCTSLATKHEVLRTGSPPFVHIITRPIKPSHLYDALVGLMPDIDGITDNATDNATDSDTASDTLKHPAPAATSRQSTHTPLPQQIGQTPMSHSSNEEMRPDTPDNIDLRVLLVEDNAFNQKVALRFLDKLGYTADVANHGKEAVDRLHHTHYHIILMDVQMPEMDGFEATHHIRHSYPHPQQPYIIAMTAHAVSGDRERCIEAGMDEYISKPVKIEELRNALQHAIHTLHSQP